MLDYEAGLPLPYTNLHLKRLPSNESICCSVPHAVTPINLAPLALVFFRRIDTVL